MWPVTSPKVHPARTSSGSNNGTCQWKDALFKTSEAPRDVTVSTKGHTALNDNACGKDLNKEEADKEGMLASLSCPATGCLGVFLLQPAVETEVQVQSPSRQATLCWT